MTVCQEFFWYGDIHLVFRSSNDKGQSEHMIVISGNVTINSCFYFYSVCDLIKCWKKLIIIDPFSFPFELTFWLNSLTFVFSGTMKAACDLMASVQAEVTQCIVLIELVDLKGRDKVPGKLKSFITYEGE